MKNFFTVLTNLILASSLLLSSSAGAASYDEFIKNFFLSRPHDNKTHYFGTTDESEQIEQSAVSMISYGRSFDKSVVAVHPYAFAAVSNPFGVWGIASETLNSPEAFVHEVGAEIGVFSRNGNCSWCKQYNLYLVWGNRSDLNGEVESTGNYFNNGTSAIRLGAWSRGKSGKYSGFQNIISFDPTAFDRTVDKPYASFLDISETTLPKDVPLYLVVFKCQVPDWKGVKVVSKCGLKISEDLVFTIATDIDSVPISMNP
jgi:hypothetical protein